MDLVRDILKYQILHASLGQLLAATAVLLAGIASLWGCHRALLALENMARASRTRTDDLIVGAARGPVSWSLLLIASYLSVLILPLTNTAHSAVLAIILAFGLFLAIWFLDSLYAGIVDLWLAAEAQAKHSRTQGEDEAADSSPSKAEDPPAVQEAYPIPITHRHVRFFLILLGILVFLWNVGLENFFDFALFGITIGQFIGAFIAILVGLVLKKVSFVLLKRAQTFTKKTRWKVDDAVLEALSKPLSWGGALAGIFVATVILPLPSEPLDIASFISALLRATSIILVIWFFDRFASELAAIWTAIAEQTETRLDEQVIPIVRRSARVFLIIVGILLFLQNIGYSVGSLLAGFGLGGAAIALASKDTLSNLFGSIVIFMDRPFQIGDWIQVDTIDRTVEEIGLRTTTVRTFANSLITVPNARFTTTPINNWSRMKKRRVKMTVGVSYGASTEQMCEAVEGIEALIVDNEHFHQDFHLVVFDEFGPHCLNIFIYCFVTTTDWKEYLHRKQKFLLDVMRLFDRIGIELALPSQNIFLESTEA